MQAARLFWGLKIFKSVVLEAWLDQQENEERSDMHTEYLGLGELCALVGMHKLQTLGVYFICYCAQLNRSPFMGTELNQEAGLPNLHMKSAGEKSQVEVISEGKTVTWLIGSAYNGQSFTSIHQLTRRRRWQFPKVWATGLLNMAVFMLTHIHSEFPALPTGEDCPAPRMLR